MKQYINKIGLLSAAFLAALILAGCGGGYSGRIAQPLPGQPGNTPPPEITRPDLIQPALNTIGERIRSHEARLEEIRAIENSPASMMVSPEKMGRLSDCKTSLLDILTNYDALQKRLQRETNLDAAQNLANNMLQQVNLQDMQYLEGDCNRLVADLRQAETMKSPPVYQDPVLPQPGYGVPPAWPDDPAFSGDPAYPGDPGYAAPAAPDPQIGQAYAAGDYTEVISLYNRNWGGPGRSGRAAPATTWQYGQALLKNYQTDEARRVLSGLDAQLERQGGDPLSADVLRALGDIAFGGGSYQEAQQYYSREINLPGGLRDSWSQRQLAALREQGVGASQELSDYAALLRAWLAYAPARDGFAVAEQAERFLQSYPASRLVANVNEIHRATRERADARQENGGVPPAAQAPENVYRNSGEDGLPPSPATDDMTGNAVDMGAPEPANGFPGQNETPPLPTTDSTGYAADGGNTGAIAAASEDPGYAAAPLSAEQIAAREQALREQYERGLNQMASGNYDAAIQTFSTLRGSSLDAEARSRLNEAAARAGESNRQRAAELFVRANQTADTETRRRLLVQSRDLLRDIPLKYPQAGLDDKVARNLASVEDALDALGPAPAAPYMPGEPHSPPPAAPTPSPAEFL